MGSGTDELWPALSMVSSLRSVCVSMHFWAPDIDPAHPLECTQPERYVLQRLDNRSYIALSPVDQSLQEVEDVRQAHFLHTHEAALRAAVEINRISSRRVDVVKVD